MRHAIVGQEARSLAAIAAALRSQYIDPLETEWSQSPFGWILKRRSSRQRGKIGEQLVADWCATHKLHVARSPTREADRMIEGHAVEIKFSTLWTSGKYVFQQIRDQKYEYLLCLGISPFEAHAWLIPKSDIPFSVLHHQHVGQKGVDTWWLSIDPHHVDPWLQPYGGSMSKALKRLRGLRRTTR